MKARPFLFDNKGFLGYIFIMKNIKRLIVLTVTAILIVSFTSVNAFAKEVPFTQDDRDRLIRVEEGLKAVNQRIDDTNKRIDTMQTFMLWGFGILFGGMGVLIGFVIWDRRTALAPAIRKNKELEEREERLEKALLEYAKKEPRLAEIFKNMGLM
jgi:cytochrome c-type biogenesis protein CcmH/NrfF